MNNNMMSFFCERTMKGNNIALTAKIINIGICDMVIFHGIRVISKYFHTEAFAYINKNLTYFACSYYSYGFSVKVKPGKSVY